MSWFTNTIHLYPFLSKLIVGAPSSEEVSVSSEQHFTSPLVILR